MVKQPHEQLLKHQLKELQLLEANGTVLCHNLIQLVFDFHEKLKLPLKCLHLALQNSRMICQGERCDCSIQRQIQTHQVIALLWLCYKNERKCMFSFLNRLREKKFNFQMDQLLEAQKQVLYKLEFEIRQITRLQSLATICGILSLKYSTFLLSLFILELMLYNGFNNNSLYLIFACVKLSYNLLEPSNTISYNYRVQQLILEFKGKLDTNILQKICGQCFQQLKYSKKKSPFIYKKFKSRQFMCVSRIQLQKSKLLYDSELTNARSPHQSVSPKLMFLDTLVDN